MKSTGSITAIIVDDDEFCCFQLQDLIKKYALGIEIVAVCNSGADGLIKIRELSPDLVFLDVEMPGMNGFEMIRKLPAVNFEIIFTTSHEQYAIRAIRFSALDYLVKPLDSTALQDAISRMRDKMQEKLPAEEKKLELLGIPAEKKFNNLAVPTMEGLLFIGLQDIIRCESDDKYTKIFLADKKMILASRTQVIPHQPQPPQKIPARRRRPGYHGRWQHTGCFPPQKRRAYGISVAVLTLAITRGRRCALFAIAISAKAKLAPAHLAKDNALASNCDGEAVS